jgi:hypothetical protein
MAWAMSALMIIDLTTASSYAAWFSAENDSRRSRYLHTKQASNE